MKLARARSRGRRLAGRPLTRRSHFLLEGKSIRSLRQPCLQGMRIQSLSRAGAALQQLAPDGVLLCARRSLPGPAPFDRFCHNATLAASVCPSVFLRRLRSCRSIQTGPHGRGACIQRQTGRSSKLPAAVSRLISAADAVVSGGLPSHCIRCEPLTI